MSMPIVIYLSILFLLISSIKSQVIIIPLFLDFLLGLTIVIGNLGSTQTPNVFSVSLTTNHSAVFPGPTYNKSLSTSFKSTNEKAIYQGNISGVMASDSIYFANDHYIDDLQFIYINEAFDTTNLTWLFSSTLSFSRSSASLLNQLQSKGVIKRRVLSFGKGNLTVGSIDESLLSYNVRYTKAIPYQNQWASIFKGLIIGPIPDYASEIDIKDYLHLSLNHLVVFHTNESSIIAPHRYYDFFINNYFSKDIIQAFNCEERVLIHKDIFIDCTKGVLSQLPPITFFIDEIAFTFEPKHLFNTMFELFTNRVSFRIQFNKNPDDERWVFGSGVIKTFNLVFDEESSSIGYSTILKVWNVSSNFPSIQVRTVRVGSFFKWACVLGCGLSLGVILLLGVKVKLLSSSVINE